MYLHVYIYIYIYTHTYTRISLSLYIYIYIYTHAHTCNVSTYMCIYICIRVCVYIYIYIYIYVYDNIHTQHISCNVTCVLPQALRGDRCRRVYSQTPRQEPRCSEDLVCAVHGRDQPIVYVSSPTTKHLTSEYVLEVYIRSRFGPIFDLEDRLQRRNSQIAKRGWINGVPAKGPYIHHRMFQHVLFSLALLSARISELTKF